MNNTTNTTSVANAANAANTAQTASSERNSSIELLRIFSMVLIIFHHFAVHGRFGFSAGDDTLTHHYYNLIIMGGKIGVDIFVLISGYFLVASNSTNGTLFNFKRIAKFYGQVAFYAVAICLVFSICLDKPFTFKTLAPLTNYYWWFATTYFLLYLIHPFLNKMLNALDKREYQCLVGFLILACSLFPTFGTFHLNNLIWFVSLYAIAGYARRFDFNPNFTAKHYFLLGGGMALLTYLTSVALVYLNANYALNHKHNVITYLYGQERITVLLISLFLFMAFAKLNLGYHKWINVTASATFGIYLIHDSNLVRPFLWVTLFKNAQYKHDLFLIPYSIMAVFAVFVVCTLIDLLRQFLFEKPFMFLVNRYLDAFLTPFRKLYSIFAAFLFGKEKK